MPVYLDALALQFYRGIGPEMQFISPFSEMNFFIGANNSGKSTVLNFINNELSSIVNQTTKRKALGGTDQYRGSKTDNLTVAIGIPKSEIIEQIITTAGNYTVATHPHGKETVEFCELLSFLDHFWVRQPKSGSIRSHLVVQDASRAQKLLNGNARDFPDRSLGLMGNQQKYRWALNGLTSLLGRHKPMFPKIKLIPAKRQLGPKDETFDDQSGKGLIDELAAIQSPDHHEQERRDIFHEINAFVREVTGKPDAKIEVPHDRKHLLVHMDNKVLPLSSLGTGIHEVILIAAFCTIHQEQIICMEEPEIHLHPVLQRKLIQYLQENTVNQYFIATHSAAFIDTPNSSVFRVTNDGVQTHISSALLRDERRQICDDLGYKASDIMQANAIIWVEGPSDRTYVKHWLNADAPNLQEGIDFSIMFYGGRLLSHLTADAEDVQEFIDLRALNKNIAIIIDSDKETSCAEIGAAKKRIKEELSNDDGGIVWITEGREIENYIDHSVLQEAIKKKHPKLYDSAADGGPYDHAFFFKKEDGSTHKKADKVDVAKLVCEKPANLDVLDLKQRISELVEMIEKANA